MKRGDFAELRMKKVLCEGEMLSKGIYSCEVLNMDAIGEYLYVLLKEDELEELSLDGIYDCKVQTGECEEICTVRIKERYIGAEGKTLKMKVENGFYKINVKSVDKQIV